MKESKKHITARGRYRIACRFFTNYDLENCLVNCYKAIEADPKYFDPWRLLSGCLYTLNRHEEVIATCNKALEFHPGNRDIQIIKAKSLAKLELSKEALELFVTYT
jgi:tetratricopeptide (TPR) repeat protein